MKNKRLGVLIPVSSLPGNHGIGDFGDSCYHFIDWLVESHYHYWQVLPLNPLGPGFSPYMSTSSYALDFRYISLDYLKNEGLLDELPTYREVATSINYDGVGDFKRKYLYKAYLRFLQKHEIEGFRKFKLRQPWVNEYATFICFKKENGNKPWNEWKKEDIDYYKKHNNPPKHLIDEINFEIFMQYVAIRQWKHVLSYAKRKHIQIICDMPFYVGFDSVEVWLHRDQFMIDENNNMTQVSGVGPDAFSSTGQLWGTPIYNFEKMKENGYSLLINRINYLSNLCDYLRLDHFRAFDTYYVIPSDSDDARNGEWKIGPREDFFNALYFSNPHIKLIAEDLGELRPEVYQLRDYYHLPGMFVIQFMILEEWNVSNSNHIVYSGTHDNPTLFSWYSSLEDWQISALMKRLKTKNKLILYDRLMEFVFNADSLFTIIPLQDLLKLDNEARINTPGTVGGNWTWKLRDFSFIEKIKYPKKGMK